MPAQWIRQGLAQEARSEDGIRRRIAHLLAIAEQNEAEVDRLKAINHPYQRVIEDRQRVAAEKRLEVLRLTKLLEGRP